MGFYIQDTSAYIIITTNGIRIVDMGVGHCKEIVDNHGEKMMLHSLES